MDEASDTVLERVTRREVAGVFHSRDALDNAVNDLLLSGFDRADIDLMASADAVREKLGAVYVAPEELPDVPRVPRRAFVAREDFTPITAATVGMLSFIGATAAALAVVASGGALAMAVAAAAAGGTAGGLGGLVFSRYLKKEEAEELEGHLARGGLVLWVRARTPEREAQAIEVLTRHGAEAVRVHEIELDKSLDDIPLASLRPDPWLSDEPLGQVPQRD